MSAYFSQNLAKSFDLFVYKLYNIIKNKELRYG